MICVRRCWVAACLLLVACASTPPTPDWQVNAHGALQRFTHAYLTGDSRAAQQEFARARSEVARTGRIDLVARIELIRCASQTASLEFDDCPAFQKLAADASAAERAYAAYLAGHWQALDANLLAAPHRAIVLAARAGAGQLSAQERLAQIADPLARLVAAGALFNSGHAAPADMEVAAATASAQGWRRPLLAWLTLQQRRLQQSGDADAGARVQRRIDLLAP